MTITAAMAVMVGALAGGFVTGLAGFGTGLIALGIWLYVIEPATAATLVAVCSVVAQAQTIPTVWRTLDRARVWPMVVAGLIGVPVGTMLLAKLDPAVFRLSIGVLLLAFSSFMLFARVQPRILWGGRVADGVIGLAGGILGDLPDCPVPCLRFGRHCVAGARTSAAVSSRHSTWQS